MYLIGICGASGSGKSTLADDITASHNPKEYNGFKVYGDDGAQLTPQFADEIVAYMNAVEDIFAIPSLTLAEVQQSALCVEVLEKIDVPYERAVATLSSTSNNKAFPIVYTPLHGSGLIPTTRILQNAGLTFNLPPPCTIPTFKVVPFSVSFNASMFKI